MDRFEPLDLSENKMGAVNHAGNVGANYGQLHQPSFPDNRPMDIVNSPSWHNHMTSTLGPDRINVTRRVALVQPQRGQKTKASFEDSRPEGKPKSVKPRARKRPSLLRSILPMGNIPSQELPDIAVLQANTLPGAQSVDSQAILILTPQQTMPIASSQDSTFSNPLHNHDNGTVVQSTLQNITVQNVCQLSGCSISSGHRENPLYAPEQLSAHAEQMIAIPIYSHPNQENVTSLSCSQVDHNVPQNCQVAYPQLQVGKSNVQNNYDRQVPVSVDEQVPGFGEPNMATVQDAMKTLSNNQLLQVIGMIDQRGQMDELHESQALMKHQRQQQAKEKNITRRMTTMSSNVMQGQIQAMSLFNTQAVTSLDNPAAISTWNVQIPGRIGHNGKQINPNEPTPSGTHQHPTQGQLYQSVNTLQQSDVGVPLVSVFQQPHVQSPEDRPLSRNIQPSNFPPHQMNDQNDLNGPKDLNGNISYRKEILEEYGGKLVSRYKDDKQDPERIKKLEMFKKLDRKEQMALLREKYAELLKRRRKQLQMFDPKYKLSLRKMSLASRELRTLSKMTKLNCPPRLSRMIKSTRPAAKRNSQFDAKSRIITSTIDDAGSKNTGQVVIDLTRDSPSPTHEDGRQYDEEMPFRICDSRLPSYKEAIAAKEMSAHDKLTDDAMSSVAKRLLSSSQEFFKNYHSFAKSTGQSKPTATKSTKEFSAENTKVPPFDSSCGPHAKHTVPEQSTECSQADSAMGIYPIDQIGQSAFDQAMELSLTTVAPAEVFCRNTEGCSRSAVTQSQTYDRRENHFPVPCLNDTSIREVVVNNESQSSSEPVIKGSNSVFEDEAGWSSHLSCVSNGKAEEPNDSTAIKKDSAKTEMNTVYLGIEKHTLKNVVVRIEDIRKRSTGRKKSTKDINDDNKDAGFDIKNKRKRRRRLNNYEWRTRKIRRKSSPAKSVRRSRSSSLSSHHTFQDFVPTILPSRTRNTTSGRSPSSHTLATELLQHDLHNVIDDDTEAGSDGDNDLDKDYSPRCKNAKRHPIKRKKSSSAAPSGCESDSISEANVAPTSSSGSAEFEPKSNFCSYQALRVEIGENSQNHIKLKFVNVRNIRDGACRDQSSTQPLSHREHKRSRKTNCQRKDRTKTPGPSEEPKAETSSRCVEEQNAEKAVSGNLEVDCEKKSTGSTDVYDGSPDLPPGMKKLTFNKKFGETLLHRAAKLGNMEILRYCIDNQLEDVNARDKAGYTALHDSCVPGHLNVAEFLLNHGADVNSEAFDRSRPINDAVENNHVDLVRLLLAHGADPFLPTATGRTCIQQALDQSSEMRSLIFGYLEGMKVEQSFLKDETGKPLGSVEQSGT